MPFDETHVELLNTDIGYSAWQLMTKNGIFKVYVPGHTIEGISKVNPKATEYHFRISNIL